MAKFSVSIPDDQKALLDAYAKQYQLGTSAIIQQALTAFLSPEGPSPQGGADVLSLRVEVLEQYVKAFLLNYGLLRDSLEKLAGDTPDVLVPAAFPEPPWP